MNNNFAQNLFVVLASSASHTSRGNIEITGIQPCMRWTCGTGGLAVSGSGLAGQALGRWV